MQAFRWGVMQDPHHEDMWLELAKALRKMGVWKQARAACHALVTVAPAHSAGLSLLGEVEHVIQETDSPSLDDLLATSSSSKLGKVTESLRQSHTRASIKKEILSIFDVSLAREEEISSAAFQNLDAEDDGHNMNDRRILTSPSNQETSEWVRMASRTRPGQVFYFNAVAGMTQWDPPFLSSGTRPAEKQSGIFQEEEDMLAEKATAEAKLELAHSSASLYENQISIQKHAGANFLLKSTPIDGVSGVMPSMHVLSMYNTARRAGMTKTPAIRQLLQRRRTKLRGDTTVAAVGEAPTTWMRISHTFAKKVGQIY